MGSILRSVVRGFICRRSASTFLVSSLFIATLLVALPQEARAQITYTVCKAGTCDYLSPEAAVNDPAVVTDDIIDITTDTYVLSTTLLVDKRITIKANNSVFDANGLRAIDVFNPVVFNFPTNLSLTNVTIRNGQAPAGTGGGAIRISDGTTISIINGTFENNQADFGGAIYNSGSTVTTNVAVFTGNRATAGEGGAVLTNGGGSTTLQRTEIDGNQASIAGGGAAVADNSSQLNLIASTVSNNVALTPAQTVSNLPRSGTTVGSCGGWDGQTFIADADVLSAFAFDIRLNGPADLTIIPNDLNVPGQVRQGGPNGPVIATATAFAPGSTWLGTSTQTLTFILDQPVALIPGDTYAIESIVSGAYSTYLSSYDFNNPSATVDVYTDGGQYCNAFFASNWDYTFRTFGGSPGDGGGVYASLAGFAGLFNTTVSGNVGDGATAGPDSNATVSTLFSTITNNSGNGLAARVGNTDGLVLITASIVAGNGINDCDGDTTSSGYNLIGDVTGCVVTPTTGDLVGTQLAPIDPLLGPLQLNGGRTSTHAIDPTSPAFDSAGLAGNLPCSDAATDQRDQVRPNGPACDIGAYEFISPVGPLQTLINAAATGAVITVPNGSYYTESITIGDGKILRGSGPGSAVIDVTGLGESAITASGDFTLEGIRITGGNSPGNGGAINASVAGTNITLSNVDFDNNNAGLNGGAIYLLNGTLDASDVSFSNNTSRGDGGAIRAETSDIKVLNGSFNDNTAGDASSAIAGDGGAIALTNGSGEISTSVFSGNLASSGDGVEGLGGAIFNGGDLLITDTTIGTSDAGIGGGIYNDGAANLNLARSTLAGNTASNFGATAGGGIGGTGTIDVRNSTLSGNIADGNGAGLGLTGGTARLNNVTLAFNAATSGMGGAFHAESGALVELSNSLLSDNVELSTDCTTMNSLGYNLFQATSCTTQATDIVAEPLVNTLAPNGGPTLTHALQDLSPAINAGQPVPGFPQFDAGNLPLLQTQGFTNLNASNLYLAGGTFVVGSAFVKNPIDPANNFSAIFTFRIVPDTGGGSDGITFTVSDDPTALGDAGGFLGIGENYYDQIEQIFVPRGVVNGVSVEFDTWLNGSGEGANDPDADHIGIDINGSLSSITIDNLGAHGILSDGNVWTAWVDYNAATNLLEARASNNGVRPALANVSSNVDIAALTGPVAYVGFTGATGSAGISGEQRILSFSFANSCEATDQRGDPRPKGFACDIGALEGAAIPLTLGAVSLGVQTTPGNGESYPGVVDVPIIDIPIEKLTGDTFNAPESAPLGSFPLGSFPLGSFDLQNSPLGSFPLGSFPIGSFPIGSFPLGSFPLSSIPLLNDGGWSEVLQDTALEDAPLQTVTLEQVLTLDPLPSAVADIALRDMAIQGSPLASLSLPSLSLGDTTVAELNQWIQNNDPGTSETICGTLETADTALTGCTDEDTLLGLEVEGAPVSALSLASLPLGSFPIGSFPLGSFPIGSFPLGSFPLGSFPLGSFPIGSFPLGSFPLGSFPLGSFPLGSFNFLAAPIGSFPIGSFPIGSFPLGSFEIDGKSFCQFYDEQASVSGAETCAGLSIDPGTDSLADLVLALQTIDSTSSLSSTPLGSFPLGSFDISNLPLGSFGTAALAEPPISVLTLGGFNGCTLIADNSSDTCSSKGLDSTSTLRDVATAYGGSLASSPLGSFPIGSFGVANLPLGSFPIGSFEINGTPLGSFPLGSFDIVGSPLGSFPLGSFTTGACDGCATLADALRAGVLDTSKTLAELKAAATSEFAALTLGDVLDAMTLAMLYGPGTLADIEDTGNLTLGQILIAMMLKTDFPWESIPLAQLDAQQFSADNLVTYRVNFPLTGSEMEPVTIAVTMADSFLYEKGSAERVVSTPLAVNTSMLSDPAIVNNGDGTQTLTFATSLGGFGLTDNTIRFDAVPALALGDYPASAEVALGTDAPVAASGPSSSVRVIPDPFTDISDPDLALTAPADVLMLGYINTGNDIDFFRVAPPAAGDRVAVFMANPAGDNDLIMYEPLSTVEAKGQTTEAAALDSVPFEDDGVDYEGNLTEEPNALEDVNLASAPLASISTNRGDADEAVSAVAGNTDPFTIQVSGYNGATSDEAYTLRVKVTSQVPNPQCTARNWTAATTTVLPAGSWMADTNAVFLVNAARLAASDPGGAVAADAALAAINSLIHEPGITNGVVIDVSTIPGVDYTAWDANPCDVGAANDIVNAITAYLETQRAGSPALTYVTIVGSDEVIPFARKPDESSYSNESTFASELSDNAIFGSLVTRHFLSDDTYGDIDPIAWLDRYLNVPELGVGRLVESAADIQAAADNYIAFAGILDPQTVLSTGYDFIADAAQEIDTTFNDYASTLGYSVVPPLIDPADVSPLTAWTKADFLTETAVMSPNPVDLVSFNMHFNFYEALPSKGNATGNSTDDLLRVGDLAGADLRNGLWISVGCHSGTNVPDISVSGGANSLDWAQAFSRSGAMFLAQTGYGLGDTEAVALSERLLANFVRNLNGSMSVGQAHALAKQQYFADLGLYGEYDYKSLQEATLFGLPMYQFGNGAMVTAPTPPPLPVAADPISGLASASWTQPDTGITREQGTSKGDLFSVDGEVQFIHFRPLQPIVRRDVTGPAGEVAGGAFLTALTTEDIAVADIAFARPVIALGDIDPEIESDEVVFPTAFTNISSFKALPPGGGPFEPRQQLNVIVGQFTSPLDGKNNGTERLFRSFDAEVFYRPAASAMAAPATSGAATGDFLRPEFDNVQASVVGSGGAQQAAFSVDVFDEGTVLRVAVLYLQSVSTDGKGHWALVDLVQGSGTTWTGGGPVDLTGVTDGQIDYMVQAVDANGNVANSTFKGLFYVAEELPAAPVADPDNPAGGIGVVVTVDGESVNPGDWIASDPVSVGIVNQNPEITYVYSVDFAPFVPLGSSGFDITQDGVHIVTVQESDGSNPVTFVVLIDTTSPAALITTPANGEFFEQGQAPAAEFDCLDAGSGISTCVGTVPDGAPVPSVNPGSQSFTLTAQDYAHQNDDPSSPVVAEHVYHVVKPLEVGGPMDSTAITDPVTITASATELAGFTETVTIDWGDGSSPETVDLSGGSVSSVSSDHIYPPGAADVYQVTITVDYEGQYTQVGVVDFVVVFDPSDGFVTGGGWINSPPGAYTPSDTSNVGVTGKTHFGFVSKYKKGQSVPEGSTNFRFSAGNLEFDATTYDWMVISGANVRYKGKGTVNGGTELYKFQVTTLDADISGDGITQDGFRIKIWQEGASGVEAVLYDSGLGADDSTGSGGTTPLGGGSITVHQAKKGK